MRHGSRRATFLGIAISAIFQMSSYGQPPMPPAFEPTCFVPPCSSYAVCGRFDGPYDFHAMLQQLNPSCPSALVPALELNHLAVLSWPPAKAGQVLFWFNHNESSMVTYGASLTSDTYILNPVNMTIRTCPPLPIPFNHEIGCSAFPALPWGDLFAMGGHLPWATAGSVGTKKSLRFDATTEGWIGRMSGHVIPVMSDPRHYGMATVLPPIGAAGTRILAVAGNGVSNYQVLDVQTGVWSNPAGIPSGLNTLNYTYAHLLPNNFPTGGYSSSPGLVFFPNPALPGSNAAVPTYFFDPDPAATPAWIDLPNILERTNADRLWGSSVILCRPDPNHATRYKPFVALIGGCCRATSAAQPYTNLAQNTIEFIEDPSDPSALWHTSSVSLGCGRVYIDSVVLPTGRVAILGGLNASYHADLTNPAPYAPTNNVQLYTPPPVGSTTGDSVTTLAADTVIRAYHPAAGLLADGRVLKTGGENTNQSITCPLSGGWCDASFFEPPYLHQGARPSGLTASGSMAHGTTADLTVTIPEGKTIGKVTLTRPCTSTHNIDFDQRYIELRFTPPETPSGTVTFPAQIPTSEYVVPPGFYMLWVVTTDGLPSDAHFIRIPGPELTS